MFSLRHCARGTSRVVSPCECGRFTGQTTLPGSCIVSLSLSLTSSVHFHSVPQILDRNLDLLLKSHNVLNSSIRHLFPPSLRLASNLPRFHHVTQCRRSIHQACLRRTTVRSSHPASFSALENSADRSFSTRQRSNAVRYESPVLPPPGPIISFYPSSGKYVAAIILGT